MTILFNRWCWVDGVSDDDLHRGDDDLVCLLKGFHIKHDLTVHLFTETHQVERGKITRRVVQEHVLRTGVGGIDAICILARVPTVGRCIVLHAWIPALPSCIGNHLHELSRFPCLNRFTGSYGMGGPWPVILDRLHKAIGHTHRVVRILKIDAGVRIAIK